MATIPEADYRPRPPVRTDLNVGLIGCGGIAHAHAQAYQRMSVSLVACMDLEHDRAVAFAEQYGAEARPTYQEVVERPDVDLVDICTGPLGRVEIVEAATAAGKHVILEKPFSHSYEDAVRMVELAEAAGVKSAVSQNSRWMPHYRAATDLIRKGVIGEVFQILLTVYGSQDRHLGRFYVTVDNFLLLEWAPHHFDIMRQWAGRSAQTVSALVHRVPGQRFKSEMAASALLDFGGPLQALMQQTEAAGSDQGENLVRIQGTEGAIHGRNPFQVCVAPDRDTWHPVEFEGEAWGDAMLGSLAEFINAIAEDREPEHSARDNLDVIRTCLAAVKSAAQGGRPVTPDEVGPLPQRMAGEKARPT